MLVDLSALDIRSFDYTARPDDDFRAVAERMLEARAILFATPVYWYAMSGRMKTLFDRFTDLLSDRDEGRRGRALAGRQVWLLAVGTDAALPPGFDEPFRRTAAYLGMDWRSWLYLSTGTPWRQRQDRLAAFAAEIETALG